MSDPNLATRSTTIEAVKTPLAFIVLGLLVVEASLTTLAVTLEDQRNLLVWTIVLSIPTFVAIVVSLAIWRPEALRGDRPLQKVYAHKFADDLHASLDGPFSNLTPTERAEAWATLADIISNSSPEDRTYLRFCMAVAARIRVRANLEERVTGVPGPVK